MASSALLPVDLSGLRLQPGRGLARQLYQALRERMLDGRLPGGTRLPASRQLAERLGVSRNTVNRALDQLYAEGYVQGRVGDGTYVADIAAVAEAPVAETPGTATSAALQLLDEHHLPSPLPGAPRAFRVGVPAFDLFPFETWARLSARFWRRPSPARLGYGDPAGDPQLRELIAAYLRSSRGLQCDPAQIIVTCGAQQAISLCAQLLIGPGDPVAVEDPGYRAAAHAFTVAGARLRGIAIDADGLDVAALERAGACRLVYVTPSHQYPTGVTLSLSRRLALLDWAERNEAWIIEDDYDGEYRYSGTPLAPLAALDRAQRVLYVGTFCKIAFPALRLGYLVLPPRLARAFARRRAVDMRHCEIGTQAVMAEFIAAGHFQRHIRRMRNAARARRDALLAGWPWAVPGCASLPEVQAGLHVSVRCESLARERELVAGAAAVGVEINPLSAYWLPDSNTPQNERAGLVLGFAAVPEKDIDDALQALRGAWNLPSHQAIHAEAGWQTTATPSKRTSGGHRDDR
ncbi:PLP-dependent aminotransferase family protein [Pseudomonas daroniae]|uniref:PLP-dependent aminotransferase family protein n=1 Tax=Phytopseudomonas daroniae TaxID=2487519 RepID=A0A4Q9QHX3_9GAMM|nr:MULTISPECIES: PLP-dependent aminotransferase family protein [Pseudomonas]TBU72785.1 PLP-dependent aminotransferase family protein [Pseudomonas daroniae]TBU77737.1 PLP-dependent aminotransferase family protein [Pseudomonas sp. FRB 228]TBU87699.1 PLP-dependent aminotransferase family protein [Pseudomonas daroniae]